MRQGAESALGKDLSTVRLHAGREADQAAARLHTAAFALGNDIWFSAGRLDTSSSAGRTLLGHELVHAAEHAHANRIHRAPQAAATKIRRTGPGSAADPVVLMDVSKASGAAVLTTRSGARIDGRMDGLNLDPGSYRLTVNYSGRIWTIAGASGGLRFTLTIPDPATANESPPGLIDPFDLTYSDTSLRVTPGATPQAETRVNLDVTFATMATVLNHTYVTGTDEKVLIHLIEEVPSSQSEEFLRRLSQQRPGGDKTWLEDLDSRVTGENNQLLHEALSLQRLRKAPEKSVASLLAAPVLPWHDVMGFFEDAATFTAERAGPGKVRVRYLGGTRLINSKQFGSEISRLNKEIFIGGVIYDDDQPLVIHDYDSGRFVTVVATELAGYEHLGVRHFLGHVATVAAFAIPVSAATSVAGKVAVVTLERVLPAMFLLVDENRLNLVKWFPKWGPQMIRYSDTLKTFAAAVGFARIAVSGFQIFQQWRAVSRARAAMEGAATLDAEANRVAAALERQAEQAYTHAEQVRNAEQAAAEAQSAGTGARAGTGTVTTEPPPTTQPPPTTVPSGQATTGGATRAATAPQGASRALEGINDETRSFLGSEPGLRQALERSPHAVQVLKACQSLCYPRFVTQAQIARLEVALERAENYNIAVNLKEVQRALKAAQNREALDSIIVQVEQGVGSRIQVAQEFKAASQAGSEARALEAGPVADSPFLTEALRGQPGRATGGLRLTDRTRLLEPGSGTGPFPGQIAARMRAIGDFKDWADFRQTFWKLVAEDPVLNQGWIPVNLQRMRAGKAPFAGAIGGVPQATGGGANAVLQLNHIHALKNAGEVFNIDNLEIVTPLFHTAIGR